MNDYRISIAPLLRRFLDQKGILLPFVAHAKKRIEEDAGQCASNDIPFPSLPSPPYIYKITSIIEAFPWHHTPEGFEYWNKLNQAFREYQYRHHFRSKYPTK